MLHKNLRILSCMVLVTGALSGLAGCSGMPCKSIRTEEKTTVSDVDGDAAEYDSEGQSQETEEDLKAERENADTEWKDIGGDRAGVGKAKIVNAAEFGSPKEVLDTMPITSNVEVKRTGEDELKIDFELENVGLCTFAAGKGKDSVLPNEVFVDSTKVEWTALTADGEYLFPYMRVNESGDMFMIDWTYNGYNFAIYGKSPQETSDRDMAGKIALAIIYNLSAAN